MKKINTLCTTAFMLVLLISTSYTAIAQKDRVFIVNQKLHVTADSVVLMPGGYSLSFSGLHFSFVGKKNTFLINSIRVNFIDGRTFVYDSINFKAAANNTLVLQLPPEVVVNALKISQIVMHYNTKDAVPTEKNSVLVYAVNLTKEKERIDLTGFEPFYISAESGRFTATEINQVYPRN